MALTSELSIRQSIESPQEENSAQSHLGLILLAIATFVMLLLIVPCAWMGYAWRDITPREPLTEQSSWPLPLRDLRAAATRRGIDMAEMEAYLVNGRPGDMDSTVFCRMPESPNVLEFLKRELELRPLAINGGDVNQRLAPGFRVPKSLAPAKWWETNHSSTELFVSRRMLEGDEGDLYVVVRDPTRRLIFIRYYYNF
jgi:hypothetical protein